MISQTTFSLSPKSRGCHLVTSEILHNLGDLPKQGLLNIFVQHTSCALSINENFDPDVRTDLSNALDRIAPENANYLHADEGPDDMPAHIKSSLIGTSLSIPISNAKLALGTWQGIYLCEFRNFGGPRRIVATIIA